MVFPLSFIWTRFSRDPWRTGCVLRVLLPVLRRFCTEGVLDSEQSSLGYGMGLRGDYCLLDSELADLPSPGQADTTDAAAIQPAEHCPILSKDFLLRPSSERPSLLSASSPSRARTLPGHYTLIVRRLIDSNMAELLPPSDSVIENSVL